MLMGTFRCMVVGNQKCFLILSHIVSLCLGFHICKMEIIAIYLSTPQRFQKLFTEEVSGQSKGIAGRMLW